MTNNTSSSSSDQRRSLQLFNLRHLGIGGRRRGSETNTYVDQYETRLMVAALTTILCCFLDATFTLNLLSMGATEMNVVMARLIETDIRIFINFKIALTSLSLVLLVIHKNFLLGGRIRVEHILYGFCAAYLVLIGYELVLLAR